VPEHFLNLCKGIVAAATFASFFRKFHEYEMDVGGRNNGKTHIYEELFTVSSWRFHLGGVLIALVNTRKGCSS
jgi:hypothetical protein